MATSDLEAHANQLKALGGGALALFNAAIMLAIIAVVLSSRAQTAQVVQSAFGLLSWLVQQVVAPVTPDTTPQALTATLAPAFGTTSSTSTGGTTPTTASGGNGSVALPFTGLAGLSTVPDDIATMTITP